MMDLVIRKVAPEDLESVLPLVRSFHVETLADFGLSYDSDQTKQTIAAYIKNHLALVAEVSGQVVGVVAGVITPYDLNHDLFLFQEAVWYVLPEHRASSIGIRLMDALETQLKAKGVRKIIMVSMDKNGQKDTVERFYLSRGFKLMESHFIKDLGE